MLDETSTYGARRSTSTLGTMMFCVRIVISSSIVVNICMSKTKGERFVPRVVTREGGWLKVTPTLRVLVDDHPTTRTKLDMHFKQSYIPLNHTNPNQGCMVFVGFSNALHGPHHVSFRYGY